ncbi:MAG: hypothetical protein HY720_24885 [Planctomycetes bacterium]|nr:hypothetical protein [Planctomycetota bacterium]
MRVAVMELAALLAVLCGPSFADEDPSIEAHVDRLRAPNLAYAEGAIPLLLADGERARGPLERFVAPEFEPGGIDREGLARTIAALGADGYEVREEATRRLEDEGLMALPALERGLADTHDLEVESRLARVVEPMRLRLAELRAPRQARFLAVLALARIGCAESVPVLSYLRDGGEEIVSGAARFALAAIAATRTTPVAEETLPGGPDLPTTLEVRYRAELDWWSCATSSLFIEGGGSMLLSGVYRFSESSEFLDVVRAQGAPLIVRTYESLSGEMSGEEKCAGRPFRILAGERGPEIYLDGGAASWSASGFHFEPGVLANRLVPRTGDGASPSDRLARLGGAPFPVEGRRAARAECQGRFALAEREGGNRLRHAYLAGIRVDRLDTLPGRRRDAVVGTEVLWLAGDVWIDPATGRVEELDLSGPAYRWGESFGPVTVFGCVRLRQEALPVEGR